MNKTILFFVFFSFSNIVYSQTAGNYRAKWDENNYIEITIDNNKKYSIEMINTYASKTNNILLSFGDVKQIADTLYLKDKIDNAEIKIVYSDDKNEITIKKGFYLIGNVIFKNTNNFVDENYYSSIAINKFELPHTTDLSAPKIAVYYTSDEQYNLKLEKGKYIYSMGNIIISYGNWVQKKDIIELTDKHCNAVFQFKKISEEELVCNTIFGITKYNNPNISSTSNHFYIPK